MEHIDFASMLDGHKLPHRPAHLAHIVSIALIGPGRPAKDCLLSIFRVQRHKLRDALLWLKHHNPHYTDLHIAENNLTAYPEDDVPVEIMALTRHCPDAAVLDNENGGYVAGGREEVQGTEGKPHVCLSCAALTGQPDIDGGVIPLSVSAVIDTELSTLSSADVVSSGLTNLTEDAEEGAYGVRHGSKLVRDFPPVRSPNTSAALDDVDYFERAFPCLFPWGQGGLYRLRPVKLDFRDHVQWALRYADRRFRQHDTFPFVAFAIIQRRQALAGASIQMKTKRYHKDIQILRTVTLDKLRHAQVEEEAKKPISDLAIQVLKTHVNATLGGVLGSDQSRYQMRSQIWSTTMCKGPPTLWMTINPSDLHDPIAQVFVGEDIDLDKFTSRMGPDAHARAKNIAKDPYAASEYFHFIIDAILDTLFKVKVTKYKVNSKKGVLGEVDAYFGMKEVQGRGTIHLHILIWLKNTPSPDQLQFLLRQESFRDKIKEYLSRNVCAYVPGMETANSIKHTATGANVAYARPPNPDSVHYAQELQMMETQLACVEQVHECKLRRCLIPDKKTGRYQCKRRAPFECTEDDFVMENGRCGPKRLHGFVNAWNPAVLINGRCNNDVKFLTNGSDTKNISFYITMYATKKHGRSYNLSSVMAEGLAYHILHPNPTYIGDIRKQQSQLLFRLGHAINRQQEIAATMAMTYLMGRSDAIRSHIYTPIYWSAFMAHFIATEKTPISADRCDCFAEAGECTY